MITDDLVLSSVPKISAINIVGLNNLILPFTPHAIGGTDQFDAALNKAVADDSHKYYIKSITGLEPPPRSVAISATAGGGKFQGVTSEEREVVVLIGLNPDLDAGETPSLLRQNLETMLYPGYDPRVDIQAVAGVFPIFHEYGYVSNFEASIFDANPAVQITFTMLNYNFRAYSATTYDPAELSESNPDIYNYGTAETGFQFGVRFTANKKNWFIKQTENQAIGMTFEKDFVSGDKLFISTVPGQKFVHFQHGKKKVTNALGLLSGDSEWIQLHPGHNHFVVPKKAAAWDWKGQLTFTARYAGI